MGEFIRTHFCAINYELQNFWFAGFGQDMDRQHIEVLAEGFITKDLGVRITRSKEYIKVHFAKPLSGIMAEEWYVEKVEVVNKNGK